MAYNGESLEELLKRNGKKVEEELNPVFDDLLFDIPEPPAPKLIDLDTCLANAMRDLEQCHLTAEEQQMIQEFLTFWVQARQARIDRPEARRAYCSLLVHSEEKESIRRFANILATALACEQNEILLCTEDEMHQLWATSPRMRRGDAKLIPEKIRFLLIDECQEAPRINMDGGSAVRDASKKAVEAYNGMWNAVLEYIRQNSNVILIVGSDESVFRSTLRPFKTLSQRVCNYHIQLLPQTADDLVQDCLAELRKSPFTLSDDFEQRLQVYFRNAYRASDLQGQAFVADLINQIYTRYYCRRQDGQQLTADCIPQHDPMALSVESVLGQLDNLVGLEAVKKEFRNIYNMQMAGLTDPKEIRYHMLFSGNPGTGKTTVAQMAADLLFRMGVIKTNKLLVVKPCDLISEWIGGTGAKAMEVIHRAYNGVLFVDEAYGIANMDRGRELLNVLLQEMENNSDKLVVIFAGYTEEMRELLKANPGLASRIGQEIAFEDYTQQELAQIFLQMCKKDGFSLDPNARDELDECIAALMTREFFGNARDIRNLLQDLKEAWSNDYYAAVTKTSAAASLERVFLPRHFESIMPPKKEISVNDLIGLSVLKNKLEAFKKQALYQKHLREKGFKDLSFSMHMIFAGNPGTGKTTVAKLIADDLYSIGMLKTNRLVVAGRRDLIGIRGDTAQKTADVIRKAVGGVLFVDEAYSLASDRVGGAECIDVLLTAMEEHKSDTVFVFAGYEDEMQDFLAMNPGIQSRIGYTFHFEDYSAPELTRMYGEKMAKTGFVVAEDALQRVYEIMEYFQAVKNFGNGRFVDHVIHQTICQRAVRDFMTQYRDICIQDIPSVKDLIETAPNSMRLYDPAEITPEEQRRTAIHEVGHAVVMLGLDPNNGPESISIRSRAGSFGRVTLPRTPLDMTEDQLLNRIAGLLGGKNAEKHILGSHSTGCANDYMRAKQLAEKMIQNFGMISYGRTPDAILAEADKRAMDVLAAYTEQLKAISDLLLAQKELSGEEFVKILRKKP